MLMRYNSLIIIHFSASKLKANITHQEHAVNNGTETLGFLKIKPIFYINEQMFITVI